MKTVRIIHCAQRTCTRFASFAKIVCGMFDAARQRVRALHVTGQESADWSRRSDVLDAAGEYAGPFRRDRLGQPRQENCHDRRRHQAAPIALG